MRESRPSSRRSIASADDDPVDPVDPEKAARTIVLRRLSSSPRTRKDLADDLARRGIPEDVVITVLDRFTEVGLIDDAEYARLWVSSRHRSKGTARASLKHELRSKGITDDDAIDALGAIDDDAERSRGLALVRSKLSSTARLEPAARARRLVNVLMRRGYRQAEAVSIVKEAVAELDEALSGADESR